MCEPVDLDRKYLAGERRKTSQTSTSTSTSQTPVPQEKEAKRKRGEESPSVTNNAGKEFKIMYKKRTKLNLKLDSKNNLEQEVAMIVKETPSSSQSSRKFAAS